VVERGSLENCWRRKALVGSNPTPSALQSAIPHRGWDCGVSCLIGVEVSSGQERSEKGCFEGPSFPSHPLQMGRSCTTKSSALIVAPPRLPLLRGRPAPAAWQPEVHTSFPPFSQLQQPDGGVCGDKKIGYEGDTDDFPS
jgi:hypothetical protein